MSNPDKNKSAIQLAREGWCFAGLPYGHTTDLSLYDLSNKVIGAAMPNLGINAAMGETVRTVGPISFVRGVTTDPTYDIHHQDFEGEPGGHIYRGPITGLFCADLFDGNGWTGPDLIAIGQFVNDLNEHYADDGNRDAKDLDPEG